MNAPRFSVGEAIRFGWKTVTGNLGLFLLAILVIAGIGVLPALFKSAYFVVAVVAGVLEAAMGMGFMRMALRFVDGEKGELADLFSAIHLVVTYIVASILVSIIAGVGFILLVLPGIYVAFRLFFFGWVIVDKELGPVAAVKTSWAMTRGVFWQIFLLMLALFGVNLLGLLALGVGLLITGPMSVVAVAHVYRRLEWATRE